MSSAQTSVKPALPPSSAQVLSASPYGSKSSTSISPSSPMSSHDSPQPSTTTPASSSAKPQLAIKPVPSTTTVRPLQRAGSDGAAPEGSAMSKTSVMSPLQPQSPAAAQSLASVTGTTPTPASITSKQWVIPPRPKPGRKPATDTPPTKRKAQNRAAQRAFRERRAARVGELEDQLEEQKTDHDRVEREYQDKIRSLETEVQALRNRCQTLEGLLEKEKAANQAWAKDRQHSTQQDTPLRNDSIPCSDSINYHDHQPHGGNALSPAAHRLARRDQPRGSTSSSVSSASGRRSSAQPFSISQIISPPEEEDLTCGACNPSGSCACAEEVIAATAAMDCGKCSLGTKCICLEESINALSGKTNNNDLKRPHSSSSPQPLAPGEKKLRRESHINNSATEIDFTRTFSRPKSAGSALARTPLPSMQPRLQPQPFQQQAPRFEIPLKDKCGFCSDGTYCVCAETMPGVTMTGSVALSAGTVVAQQKTPPPSESDSVSSGAPVPLEVTATGAIKLSSLNAQRRQNRINASSSSDSIPLPPIRSSMCGPGGPGTCAQCLADPVSGLFCRSLAASMERQGVGSSASGGCCGGSGPDGGCCKVKEKNGETTSSVDDSKAGRKENISLSCADAYKTLASHRHFGEATDEISTWLPKLRAVPRHDVRPTARHPMEVEAASIMSVLKGFDVRFGKSA